jgi:rRNA maturation endonuclease Nob1
MARENAFEFICENCDNEYKITAPLGGNDPEFCPFCGEKNITLESTISVEDGLIDEGFEVIEDDSED